MRTIILLSVFFLLHLKGYAQSNLSIIYPLRHNLSPDELSILPLPATNKMLTYGDDSPILWDMQFGIPVRKLSTHGINVSKAICSDNKLYTLGGANIRVWNMNGDSIGIFSFQKGRGIIDFTINYPYLLAIGFEEAQVWHLPSKKLVTVSFTAWDSWGKKIQLSPDKKYFLTHGTVYSGSSLVNSTSDYENHAPDSSIRIWDIVSGLPLATLTVPGTTIDKWAVDEKNNYVYVLTENSKLKRFSLDLSRYSLLRSPAASSFLPVDGEKRLRVMADLFDSRHSPYDLITQKGSTIVRLPADKTFGKENILDFVVDGKQLLTFTSDENDLNTVTRYNTSGAAVNKISIDTNYRDHGYTLQFDGQHLLINSKFHAGFKSIDQPRAEYIPLEARNIHLFDSSYLICSSEEGFELRSLVSGTVTRKLTMNPNKLMLSFLNSNEEIGMIEETQSALFNITADNKLTIPNSFYSAGTERYINDHKGHILKTNLHGGLSAIIDQANGMVSYLPLSLQPVKWVSFSAGGNHLYGYKNDTIIILDSHDFRMLAELPQPRMNHFEGKYMHRAMDPQFIEKKMCSVIAFSDDEKYFALSLNDSTVQIKETAGNKLINSVHVPFEKYEEFSALYFKKNSHDLLYFNGSGDIYRMTKDRDTGVVIGSIDNMLEDVVEVFQLDHDRLLINTDFAVAEIIDMNKGKSNTALGKDLDWIDFIVSDDQTMLAGWDENGLVTVYDIDQQKILLRINTGMGRLQNCLLNTKKNQLITISGAAVMYIYDIASGAKQLSVINHPNEAHNTIIPGNYYASSKNAVQSLFFKAGENIYTSAQFDLKLNRPDLVLKAAGNTDSLLIKSYYNAYLKRLNRLHIDTASLSLNSSVPIAGFSNRNKIKYEQPSDKLEVNIHATDLAADLSNFNIWINDVPLYGRKGLDISNRSIRQLDTSILLKLSQGVNRIEVGVTNKRSAQSYRQPLYVNAATASNEAHVYFIGIGIDRFADPANNLQYSVKDIRDQSKAWKNKYPATITIDTLMNEQVTAANVSKLKERLRNSSVNDKVIIAYSGHGLLDNEFNYYLSTYAIDFDNPARNGLAYDSLEALLDEIPARNKLLLIDACNSGEVDKEDLIRLEKAPGSLTKGLKPVGSKTGNHLGLKNSFELMRNLFVDAGQGTGAIIISAAAGTQFALEKNDLKNGVFTYCILDAMRNNEHMTGSALKKQVSQRVEEITNGLQSPTSRAEVLSVDWQLW